ncbi:hypothetical protein [Parerythrobacter lacustris]|uniref:Biopolymer transporter ExbD n=1 Tax=Parerythrobacter lacustris TaxID=2969984 RepID=A0ABT1XM76_9SPHN|nr:hypothetical protein [Parerythrobacter lacustris]MCR2832760.1 hypothetical protein [Parerythrobacter lacustris]
MPAGPGSHGWLVSLADLSLILFIVTSGAIASSPIQKSLEPIDLADLPALGVASEIYVDGPGAPSLSTFLSRHSPAAGEQLTITGVFGPGERQTIARRMEALEAEAIAKGTEPRVILQPGSQAGVYVAFAHDADPQMAQDLRKKGKP